MNMKKYKIYGLLPMTKEQMIAYLESSHELTKIKGSYVLTGGIPRVGKDGKITYRYPKYSGYKDYFMKMLQEGIITEAYQKFTIAR